MLMWGEIASFLFLIYLVAFVVPYSTDKIREVLFEHFGYQLYTQPKERRYWWNSDRKSFIYGIFQTEIDPPPRVKDGDLNSLRVMGKVVTAANVKGGVGKDILELKIYIKVHTATRWTIRHGLMLLWFTDLMNVTV